MTSQNLINALSQPINHTARAFEARTNQLNQERSAQAQADRDARDYQMKLEDREFDRQVQRDNQMLKVFEYAGDGRVEEAKYLAQKQGLEVPDTVFQNADFAKGLATAGELYGDDPVMAQKFTEAWLMSANEPDLGRRVLDASQAAGRPVSPEDRQFNLWLRKEQWKKQNTVDTTQKEFENWRRKEQWKLDNIPQDASKGYTLSAGQVRYDANGNVVAQGAPKMDNFEQEMWNDVYQESIAAFRPPEIAEQAANRAVSAYRQQFQQPPQQQATNVSPNLMQPAAMPQQQAPAAPQPTQTQQPDSVALQGGVNAVQSLLLKGLGPDQIESTLIQRGASPAQARLLLEKAGAYNER